MKNLRDQIWEAALKKLEVRMQSRAELRQKLLEKFPREEGLILQVMEELERVHLLSDRRFTEEYMAHLTQKNIGMMKVLAEARKKGLDAGLVHDALLLLEWNEDDAAKRAIEEKSRLLQGVDERKKKQKLVNFLRNRGFKDSVIFKALKD